MELVFIFPLPVSTVIAFHHRHGTCPLAPARTDGSSANQGKLALESSLRTPSLPAQLGFPRARQHQYVSSLSGGERRRLHLASVLVERPNVLILDEPTNDLDLQVGMRPLSDLKLVC